MNTKPYALRELSPKTSHVLTSPDIKWAFVEFDQAKRQHMQRRDREDSENIMGNEKKSIRFCFGLRLWIAVISINKTLYLQLRCYAGHLYEQDVIFFSIAVMLVISVNKM